MSARGRESVSHPLLLDDNCEKVANYDGVVFGWTIPSLDH